MTLSERTNKIIITLAAFTVLLAGICAVYALAHQLIAVFAGLDAKFGAAVAITAGTVIVSVISVVFSRYLETRATIRKEHREKKIPVYESLIGFIFKIFMGVKDEKTPDEKELLEFMSDFTQRAIVWASDDVLNAWIQFRDMSLNEEEVKKNPMKLMFSYENVLREIRKDLGHKNKNLGKGKLLSLFINDVSNYVDADGEAVASSTSAN